MHFKEMKTVDFLFFIYVFSLAFIRIGINVFYYTFSIPDLMLVIIVFYYAGRKFNNFNMLAVLKKFLFLYLIFFVGISFSLIGIKDITAAIGELFAYFYALCLIFVFSLYIYERKIFALKNIFIAFLTILAVVIIASFLVLTELKIRNIVIFDNWSYIFFLRISSQMAVFLTICFSVYLLGYDFLDKYKFNNILNIVLPVFLFIPVVLTGSRAGVLISILLIMYFYFRLFKKMRINFLKISLIVLSLIIIFAGTMVIIDKASLARGLFWRAVSVFSNVKSFSFKGDVREEISRAAIKAFKEHPVNGAGLGNIWKQYYGFEVHNSFLSILSETGIVGFIPFVGLLTYVFFKCLKHPRRIDLLVILLCLILFGNLHHIFRQRWVWVLLIYILSYTHLMVDGIKKEN